ncbi:MAG TPA: hypothetical protein EYN07_10685 [Flavobacteriaceae bacterium]|nr:hypothetical protein [Flavobacteriaceae bacterium]HIN99694.1 hypothetical protein [Flavobacteriaceae bacterium]
MLLRLGTENSIVFPDRLKFELQDYNYVFNPSFLIQGNIRYCTFRVSDTNRGIIEALLYVWKDDKVLLKVNLTEFFSSKLKIERVADPKLFVLNNEIWGTFNTGHVRKGQNQIYLFKVGLTGVEQTYKCIYESRQRIEKNWIFFYNNNEVYCLYGLGPLSILKLEKKEDGEATFKMFFKDNNQNYPNHSLGSPGVFKDGYLYFFTHYKFFFRNRRTYFGRAFCLKVDNFEIHHNKNFYIHNFSSLLGGKKKFNPNLQSCTYISGITFLDEYALISYGINDNDWHISKIKRKKLWR